MIQLEYTRYLTYIWRVMRTCCLFGLCFLCDRCSSFCPLHSTFYACVVRILLLPVAGLRCGVVVDFICGLPYWPLLLGFYDHFHDVYLPWWSREYKLENLIFMQCNHFTSQKNPRLGENFDPIFTRGRTELTPPDANSQMILSNLNGFEFNKFSFVNPYFNPFRTEELVIPTS